MSVKGFDEVAKALYEVSELDTRQAVGEAIQFVRSAAVENCHADTGELRQSIFAEITEQEDRNHDPNVLYGSSCGIRNYVLSASKKHDNKITDH